MAKEIETYEGMLVFEATTSHTFNDATRYTSWRDNKPPYAVRIPDGRAAIKAGAFYEDDDLGAIIMPDSVRMIGRMAFYDCDKLTKVALSASLRVIGASAFEDCDELAEIRIPDSVTVIETKAFSGCDNLKEIHIKNADLLKGQDLEEDVRIIQD